MSQENTPAVLKYVMQGIRTPPKITSTGFDSDFSATEQARLPRDQQALISNSLFYTDYKKHEWLGYGRRAHDTHQPQDGNKVRHGARSLLLGPSSEPSCNMPRYHPNSRGVAPWDEREHQPQAASNSSACDRSHLFAHDPPFQRLNSQASLSLKESRMPSFIPPYADEMYPRQSNLHQYSHIAQFPISSTLLGQHPRIEARVLSGAHNHLDPDIRLRSPIPSTLPSFSLTASNNYATPTRYLKVSNIPGNISMRDARDAFKSFGDLRGAFSASSESDGKMFLEFFDIRHAMSASANPRSHPLFSSSSIKVEYCSMATMSKVSSNILDNDNEGSLSVTITRPQLTTNEIVMFLTAQGDVWSFETNTQSCPPAVIVNYFDTRHAESAVVLLREMHMNQQISCRVLYHHKDPNSSPGMDSWSLLEAHESLLYQRVSALVDSPVNGSSETPSPEASLNPKSTSSLSDTFSSMTLGMANPALSKTFLGTQEVKNSKDHHQNDAHATTGQESKMVPSGNKQTVSTDSTAATTSTDAMNKITLTEGAKSHCPTAPIQAPPRSVKDKRTTYMIRNIPNKYTQKMLLECINETHFGKFDFLYLRIDFKNKCNVGYAFINFVNVDVVDSFVKAHVGKKWDRFNSDKICSMAYAEVQGRQALIDKFRNSNVMNEDPSWRPKIFYTSGPNIGLEEPFPEPTITQESFRGPMRRKA